MTRPLYGQAALVAAEAARTGIAPSAAWEHAVDLVFPDSPESRRKSCPRGAFLGLCDAGLVRGVSGSGEAASLNGGYAVEAVRLLESEPGLAAHRMDLWRRACGSDTKRHNSQMHVVLALWEEGRLNA